MKLISITDVVLKTPIHPEESTHVVFSIVLGDPLAERILTESNSDYVFFTLRPIQRRKLGSHSERRKWDRIAKKIVHIVSDLQPDYVLLSLGSTSLNSFAESLGWSPQMLRTFDTSGSLLSECSGVPIRFLSVNQFKNVVSQIQSADAVHDNSRQLQGQTLAVARISTAEWTESGLRLEQRNPGFKTPIAIFVWRRGTLEEFTRRLKSTFLFPDLRLTQASKIDFFALLTRALRTTMSRAYAFIFGALQASAKRVEAKNRQKLLAAGQTIPQILSQADEHAIAESVAHNRHLGITQLGRIWAQNKSADSNNERQ